VDKGFFRKTINWSGTLLALGLVGVLAYNVRQNQKEAKQERMEAQA